MFIAIEGTDASGKSSLIAAVEAEIKTRWPDREISSFHKGKPEEETRRWVLNEYVLEIENTDFFKSIAVADRWHWGEVTYAPKFRAHTNKDGYGLLGVAGWRWTELFMASRGIQQFWLYQPLEVIQRRLAVRGDDFVSVADLATILDYYRDAFAQTVSTICLSPEADSLDAINALAAEIVDTAKQTAKEASKLAPFPQYIGKPAPRVLLVGDRANIPKKYGKETELAFMPVDNNSGEYLLTALPHEFWKHVGIVNINDQPFGSVPKLWETLGKPPIIALGRLAERGLMRQGFTDTDYIVLPHPQWVRRFANHRKNEYGEAIVRMTMTQNKEDEWILR